MRLTDWEALVVCTVDRTRWPVSAALMAVLKLVSSRISPIIIISGSLPQNVFERMMEGDGVQTDFALFANGLVVLKDVFYRILKRDNMFFEVRVDMLDHGRERGGFAAAVERPPARCRAVIPQLF